MRPALIIACWLAFAPLGAMAGVTGSPADLPAGLADTSKALVRDSLGAPHTANFRRIGAFRLSDGGWAVCGQVNSRNLTGLAMGWKPIYLRYTPQGDRLRLARRIVDWPADVACRNLAMGWKVRARH